MELTIITKVSQKAGKNLGLRKKEEVSFRVSLFG